MPYNSADDSFHTKKLCSRLSSSEVDFGGKTAVLRFWAPWGTYGQRTMIILGSLESAFFSLGVTAEALRVIICSKSAISLQRGSVDPKFQVEGVATRQPFFFSEN